MFSKIEQMLYFLLLLSSVIYVVNTDCLDDIAKILEFKTGKPDGICLILKGRDKIEDDSFNDLVQAHCFEVEKQNFQEISQRFEKTNCNIKKRSKRNIFGSPNCACIRAPCPCAYIPPVTQPPETRPPYQESSSSPNCVCKKAPCYCGNNPIVSTRAFPVARRIKLSAPRLRRAQTPWGK